MTPEARLAEMRLTANQLISEKWFIKVDDGTSKSIDAYSPDASSARDTLSLIAALEAVLELDERAGMWNGTKVVSIQTLRIVIAEALEVTE